MRLHANVTWKVDLFQVLVTNCTSGRGKSLHSGHIILTVTAKKSTAGREDSASRQSSTEAEGRIDSFGPPGRRVVCRVVDKC